MFFVACAIFIITFFYAMEYSGVLDVTDTRHPFALHLIFIPRINHALGDFKEAFNNHSVPTESNWTPNQMWTNGMMHPDNPLSHGQLDEDVSDLVMYGYDAQDPQPLTVTAMLLLSQWCYIMVMQFSHLCWRILTHLATHVTWN